ncbi:MAG: hypothetical protein ABIT37_08035 [Luteolibacter sp.]
MKRISLFLSAALAALSLTSCLQNETTIHLNKDGSGTLVEETTLGAQMMAMMEQMSSFGGAAGGAKKDPLADMFSEEKAKAKAAKLGEGVTLEKNEAIEKNGNKGARATYHFADINKLKVTTSEGMKDMSPMGGMGAEAPAAKPAKPINFKYADGNLTITMPEPDKTEAAPDAPKPGAEEKEAPGEQDLVMMKQMMGDMKMSLKLVVEPGIAETDATFRDGNTVTLMEMDMGKLMENPEFVKNLGKVDQRDPAAAMEMMKKIPGIKAEVKKEITVKVQ